MKARQWLTAAVTVEARVHARLMQAAGHSSGSGKGKDAQGYGRADELVAQS